jgi:hypothetical protein
MPFTNLENRHFTAAEKTTINGLMNQIETAFANKIANLTPEERKKYGSINEQNKLIVNKVKDFRDNQPTLSSADVDWVEFAADFDDRAFKQALIIRFTTLVDGLDNSKILQDYDNYQAALTDYEYAKYKASANAQGYSQKVAEIAQFFTGGANTNTADPASVTP